MQRDLHPVRKTEFTRPHARGVDHMLGADKALRRFDTDGATGFDHHAIDLCSFKDRRSVHPRALGERHSGINGIGAAVTWEPESALGPMGGKKRPTVLRLRQTDLFGAEAAAMGVVDLSAKLLHAGIAQGQRKRAIASETGVLTRFLLQAFHQVEAIFCQRRHDRHALGFAHQPGGMPGRPAGQLPAFEKRNRPARSGQMIGRGAADNTAADNDGLHFIWKRRCHGFNLSSVRFRDRRRGR